MSCDRSSCANTSNNKHFSCPPRMDDGRHFTDYRPNCHLNNLMRANQQTNNSFQYRMFLTHNANNIMQQNRKQACQKNCCGPCQAPYQAGTMMREATAEAVPSTIDAHDTPFSPKSPGCGAKRSSDAHPAVAVHGTEPLSCSQWSVGHANRLKNCCVPTPAAADAYPVDDSVVAVKRLTVPGGGVPLTGGDPNFYR